VFRYTSWRFYAISGTNILTRCHSASSLFSAVFLFQKWYTGNILGIRRNKFLKSYFARKLPEIRRGEGEGPWPRRLGVRRPGATPDDAPSPIRSLRTENPRRVDEISRTVLLRRRHRSQISRDRSLCFGTLPGRGSAPGAISISLHRRLHRLHRPHTHLHQSCYLLWWGGSSSPPGMRALPVAVWFTSLSHDVIFMWSW
jgi:hypothetical protein